LHSWKASQTGAQVCVVIYRDVCIQNEQTQGLDGQKTKNLTADTYKILQGRGNNLEVHASDPAPARGDSAQAGTKIGKSSNGRLLKLRQEDLLRQQTPPLGISMSPQKGRGRMLRIDLKFATT